MARLKVSPSYAKRGKLLSIPLILLYILLVQKMNFLLYLNILGKYNSSEGKMREVNQLGKDLLYIHDRGSWYGVLDWKGVSNDHKKFGVSNLVKHTSKIVKHGLKSINKCLLRISTKETIARLMRAFFMFYNEFIQFTSER